MRVPAWSVAAAVVTVLGLVALARGAMPQSSASGGAASNSPPIVVSDAYIRQPASPDVAAAYFTVFNTTARPDTLTTVLTGAGQESSLMDDAGGAMTALPNGVVIPPRSSVVFKPTTGHVMIEGLYGTLAAGQTVNLELDFANAGAIIVTAPVIGIYAPVPTGPAVTGAATPTTARPTTGATK